MGTADQISGEAAALQQRWDTDERWSGITRPYAAEEVVKLRGRIRETHSYASQAAEKLWSLVTTEDFVPTLGCLTGNQAVECVKAGLPSLTCSLYVDGYLVTFDYARAGDGHEVSCLEKL